ncbi:hypothetical protein SAMN05444007_10345 [Cribrihabitans marinus]|uniref:Fe-S protein n=1 Tax=Cribrihabitans marinus TaxID=1227549 RepID=A0A1H6UYN8_9RHOB|nr:DUF1289 domain-containing protein [Cribrihabitans marinus]GGH26649.1 DUF1289 domain-containing protein [Cribrihabitans marinus]SEI97351.1 hypothetical protein SAMN05444007_10345 [Cribrihabitans marinus]
MSKPVWRRNEVESPCVQICVVHPAERICTGCYRTIDEITHWSKMTAEERRAVMDELPDRAPRLARRRGGRAARLKG